MTHERTHDRARPARRADRTHDAIAPGHVSRSAKLLRRAVPEPSGLVARDDNGVASHTDDAAASSRGSPRRAGDQQLSGVVVSV